MHSIRFYRVALVLGLGFLVLSGCLLQSAREEMIEPYQQGLQHRVTFYRTDTNGKWAEQSIDVDKLMRTLDVVVVAQVQTGVLEVQMLEGPTKRVVFELTASKEGQRMQQTLQTDDFGDLNYRIKASDAFNGSYSISFQPPPTPTPTTTPTPTMTPAMTPSAPAVVTAVPTP